MQRVLFIAMFMLAAAANAGAQAAKPIVYVLSTGGTIAGSGSSSTDLSNYKPGSILGEQLVKAVPQISQIADVRVEQIVNVRSSDITIENWLTLARRIHAILKDTPSVAGFVITSGTNTLEETSYFLHLTVKSDKPVVLVGAMRPATAISADGPLNLLNAVKTAIAPESRGKGGLIVLNDEINAARDTTKTNTLRVETFKAPELGLLGYVDEDKVSFYRAPTKRHTATSEFDIANISTLPKVTILYSYIEPDASLIHAAIKGGAKGIVFAGTGNGTLSVFENNIVKEINAMPAAARPILVRSSRVGNGRVTPTAEYDAMNLVASDTLTPQKARILLMLALTKTTDLNEIRRIFAEY
ncbi:MAG TPA: asparaginase [Vicinamibacterales bacterium]|nr:asparaginase [Vicinamibacterales bacterium]